MVSFPMSSHYLLHRGKPCSGAWCKQFKTGNLPKVPELRFKWCYWRWSSYWTLPSGRATSWSLADDANSCRNITENKDYHCRKQLLTCQVPQCSIRVRGRSLIAFTPGKKNDGCPLSSQTRLRGFRCESKESRAIALRAFKKGRYWIVPLHSMLVDISNHLLNITTCEKKIGLLLIEVFRRSLIHMIMATWQRVAFFVM